MQKNKLLKINLRLFDGAAAADGGATEGDAGTTTPKAESKLPGSSRQKKTAEPKVVYGIQGDDQGADTENPNAGDTNGQGVSESGVSTTSNTLEDKRKAFEEMIEGEYKDIYAEKFQQAFNRRFRDVKGMEASLKEQKPILDMLMQRYNIADGNMANLQAALEQDDAYWENAAMEEGLTVEQYKTMKRLERENAELTLMRQRQQGEQQAQQKINQWFSESEKVKEIYPTFDFKAETQDRNFLGLLKAGLSVQQAYELMHMDEIKASTAKAAAQTAGEQMKARIQSRAERPSENGTSSQGAVIVKNDVHSLTREDRADVIRRAQRGEKIRF